LGNHGCQRFAWFQRLGVTLPGRQEPQIRVASQFGSAAVGALGDISFSERARKPSILGNSGRLQAKALSCYLREFTLRLIDGLPGWQLRTSTAESSLLLFARVYTSIVRRSCLKSTT
jgi:hypothetical protein